ncbi:MAG: Gfo/Idh/MocA family oxidoreductase [Actinobacteria bacterium]|nr:Gfo/Idh/MocA family oxidoreductase [Actinomycetota bacterium]
MAGDSPLRVGIVGTGRIATDHIVVLRKLGHEIVAVCDIDRARAEQGAPKGAAVYEDWRELLDRETLHALWVTTPPLHHRGPATAAMAGGLPVFLEKPVARTLEDARVIVETWERTGVVCAVGYQWHASEGLETLQAELAGQRIALLLGVSVGPTAARPWFLDRSSGGGNILERGSHQLDLMRAVTGDVARVQVTASETLLAQTETDPGNIEDAATLLLQFENGAVGTVVIAWTRHGQPATYSLDVVATEATLKLELDPAFMVSGQVGDRRVRTSLTTHPFERAIARFVEAVHARDPGRVFCDPRDAMATLATALACERSLLESGRAVELTELLSPVKSM